MISIYVNINQSYKVSERIIRTDLICAQTDICSHIATFNINLINVWCSCAHSKNIQSCISYKIKRASHSNSSFILNLSFKCISCAFLLEKKVFKFSDKFFVILSSIISEKWSIMRRSQERSLTK